MSSLRSSTVPSSPPAPMVGIDPASGPVAADTWPVIAGVVTSHRSLITLRQQCLDKWPVPVEADPWRRVQDLDKWPVLGRADKWPVVADTRPIVADKWPVAADKWPVVADKRPVAADTWPVVSYKWPVAADKWPVAA